MSAGRIIVPMDRSFRYSILTLAALGLLSACSSSQINHLANDGPLTPLPDELIPQDPEDHVLNAAMQDYLKQIKAPLSSRYDFTRIDLDDDGRRDALVMLKGPHHYWCNMDGCNMLVMKAGNDYFNIASAIFPVRGPLYVTDHVSEGWRDMVIRVSGQSYARAKNVANIFMKPSACDRCWSTRLMTTVSTWPSSAVRRARSTSAIPPHASCRMIS